MICPYCEQGTVLTARIKRKNKRIFICDECDTVWIKEINLQTGMGFDEFMQKEGCETSWDELEIFLNNMFDSSYQLEEINFN